MSRDWDATLTLRVRGCSCPESLPAGQTVPTASLRRQEFVSTWHAQGSSVEGQQEQKGKI